MSIKTFLLLVFIGGIGLLANISCATIGHQFPSDAVSHITIGETTQDDIRELFGTPWRIGIEDGNRTWTYGYYRYKLWGESITRDLIIRFSDKNVVISYSFNTNEIDNEMPTY